MNTAVEQIPEEQLGMLADLLMPKMTKYIRHIPEPKQQAFLLLDDLEAFYGGAAGGMKSDTLLMAALQYVDVPGYNALLLRDTYANLNKPEGLMDRGHTWLKNTDAHWNGDAKRYEFPTGATLSFGYLDGPLDHHNFQGAEYQFVGIDEVVNIRENQALYLFSRLRIKEPESYRNELHELTDFTDEQIDKFYDIYKEIPLRFRCASNPPTAEQLVKGSWVKPRYVDPETRQGVFIPASLLDNPHIDHEKYIEALNKLDPVTRAQLLDGDWLIQVKGRMFDRAWFNIVDQAPGNAIRTVRFYDPAHTEPHAKNKDPDWFASTKMSITETGLIFIEHVTEWRKTPLASKEAVLNQAKADGHGVEIVIEREPAAGTALIDDYVRLLAGFVCRGRKPEGSKRERAMGLASYAEAGNVFLVNGPWVKPFLDQLDVFPDSPKKDMADSASGAFNELVGGTETRLRWV